MLKRIILRFGCFIPRSSLLTAGIANVFFLGVVNLEAGELNDYSPHYKQHKKLTAPPAIEDHHHDNDYRDDVPPDVTDALNLIMPFAGEPDYEFVMDNDTPHFVVRKSPKWHAGFSMDTAPFSTRHDRDMENQYNQINAAPVFRIRYSFD